MSLPASSRRKKLGLVAEVTEGTTPTSPAFISIPAFENSFLNRTQTFQRSGLARSDRQPGANIGGTKDASGSITTPLVRETAAVKLLEGALGGTATTVALTVTGSFNGSGTFTRSAGNFLTDPVTSRLRVGDKVVISGTVSNNGNKTITAITSNTLVFASSTSESSVSTTFTASGNSTYVRQVIKAGTVRKSFSIEQQFPDLASPLYEVFVNCLVNTCTMNLPTEGEVTCEFGIVSIGSNGESTTRTSGATDTAQSGLTPCGASVSGTSITQDGSALSGGCISSLSIALANNRTPIKQVGSQLACSISEGAFTATLTMAIYKADNTQKAKLDAGTAFALEVIAANQTSDTQFIFSFGQLKYTAGPKSDTNSSVVESFTAEAEYSSTDDTSMYVSVVTL